jgi:hypothetical protein
MAEDTPTIEILSIMGEWIVDILEAHVQSRLMRRRAFAQAACMGALMSALAPGKEIPERSKRSLILRMAAPITSTCFVVTTREPAKLIGEDAPLPLLPVSLMWALKGWVEGASFRMADGQIVGLPDDGNWSKRLTLVNLPTGVAYAKFANVQPRVFRRGGAEHQTWLLPWKGQDGPCGLISCATPVSWKWAIINCAAEEVQVYFASTVKVTNSEKAEVLMSGGVVSFNNDGFSMPDSAKMNVLPEVVFGNFSEKGQIISVSNTSWAKMVIEIEQSH